MSQQLASLARRAFSVTLALSASRASLAFRASRARGHR